LLGFGVAAVELGRRLGVTKQAAAKYIEQLERLGYLYRAADAADGGRKLVRRTDVGHDVLARSAAIFDDLRTGWAITLGEDRLAALEHDLREVTCGALFQIDAPVVRWQVSGLVSIPLAGSGHAGPGGGSRPKAGPIRTS
jgi:biotin operon repressor